MKSLMTLAALVLSSVIPVEAEVVNSLSDCSEFFLHQIPPDIPGITEKGNILEKRRYKPICQTFKNSRTFMTLYDTVNKIPVFSASKYRGHSAGITKSFWMIEPQAGTKDYVNYQGFDKGQLWPISYGLNDIDKKSSLTLTNVVPQEATFLKGSWNRMEKCVRCVLNEYCINGNNDTKVFIITGANPSRKKFLNNKINIPSKLWSAFCCYSRSQKQWLASAHWGMNEKHKSTLIDILNNMPFFLLFKKNVSLFNIMPHSNVLISCRNPT
uniref:Uncharacterized protein n=1 Tax=Poecilia latipinna TaxID=48699 RepID=A0A3B3U4I5_9TELE